MRQFVVAAAAVLLMGGSVEAQQAGGSQSGYEKAGRGDTIVVMTVQLRHMSANDAAQLLAPYATTPRTGNSPGGDVFVVPGGRAITIRERVSQYGRMLALIRDYDKPPRELTLNYQIILADKSGRRAPEIAPLDSVLRGSLKYTGFTLLGTGALRTRGTGSEEAKIATDDFQYGLDFRLADGLGTASDASAKMSVSLMRYSWPVNGITTTHPVALLGADNVSIPLGQTVVIGTGVLDRNRAIILTVRPELASYGKGKDE